ncbi:hypothetical protein TWF694_006276 [Orbilia ellipsospora]|uniref:Uncharacterized protein n=1 Tax=Orbilia ellipsospora TaxID=2528407 RepID=A0AAV9XN15_9PEZI
MKSESVLNNGVGPDEMPLKDIKQEELGKEESQRQESQQPETKVKGCTCMCKDDAKASTDYRLAARREKFILTIDDIAVWLLWTVEIIWWMAFIRASLFNKFGAMSTITQLAIVIYGVGWCYFDRNGANFDGSTREGRMTFYFYLPLLVLFLNIAFYGDSDSEVANTIDSQFKRLIVFLRWD